MGCYKTNSYYTSLSKKKVSSRNKHPTFPHKRKKKKKMIQSPFSFPPFILLVLSHEKALYCKSTSSSILLPLNALSKAFHRIHRFWSFWNFWNFSMADETLSDVSQLTDVEEVLSGTQAGEEAPFSLSGEVDLSKVIQEAIDSEADAIVRRLLRTEPNETKIIQIKTPIDQPDKVQHRIESLLADLGYLAYPGLGELGSYTLLLEHDLPPDVYPADLWVRCTVNPGVTGWYQMQEDEVNGLPVWERKGDGACLRALATGQWLLGPGRESDEGWLASKVSSNAQQLPWGRCAAGMPPFAAPLPPMPHSCAAWSCYDRETTEWADISTSQLQVSYVPPALYLECKPNPALQATYNISGAHNLYPLYAHEGNPKIELFRGESWMVGRAESGSGWMSAMDSAAVSDLGSAGVIAQFGIVTPDLVKNWMVYNSASTKWEPGGIAAKVTRQRKYRSISRIVYCLSQSFDQKLLTLDAASLQRIDNLAKRIADAVLDVIHDGCQQGQRHFDEVLPLLPILTAPGDAPPDSTPAEDAQSNTSANLEGTLQRKSSTINPSLDMESMFYVYHQHVMKRVGEYVGDNERSSLDGVVLSLSRSNRDGKPNMLLIEYTVEEHATPADIEKAAADVLQNVQLGTEGTWFKKFYPVPPDLLAECLYGRLDDFVVAEVEKEVVHSGTVVVRKGTEVTVRIPWGTSRDLWDHNELKSMRYQGIAAAKLGDPLLRQISPPRRPPVPSDTPSIPMPHYEKHLEQKRLSDGVGSILDSYPPYPASAVFKPH